MPEQSARPGGLAREEWGVEFSRIVSFSDGVFAIAITLLVLNIQVPDVAGGRLAHALLDEHDQFFAFALSFAVIGRMWFVHHRLFAQVTAFDGRLIAINLFYLSFIVLIPFSSEVLGRYGGHSPAVILYAINLAAVTLVSALMVRYTQRHGLLRTDAMGIPISGSAALFVAAVFLASIPIALVAPGWAPFAWLVLFLARILDRGPRSRRQPRHRLPKR